jgi:hypothetical protein
MTTTTVNEMEWWGYNSQHGWVVLDRSIPCNRPGIKDDLLFFRFRDGTTFTEIREKWNPPLYRFAPNYLRELKGTDAEEAAAELEAHKAAWPAAQQEMQRERRETAERIEAERLAEEKKRKAAERAAKKQLGLTQVS